MYDWKPVRQMFKDEGWNIYPASSIKMDAGIPDLVCFTGGADVSPEFYGEVNTYSLCDPERDEAEMTIYYMALTHGIPMVGICRGGQFLNVMNGGKMIQHVGPFSGDVGSYWDGEYQTVRVDHHQAIVSIDPKAEVLGRKAQGDSLEYGVWYPETRCLCFQPHPEWGHEPTKKLFFDLIKEYVI